MVDLTEAAELRHPLMARWSFEANTATRAVVAWGRARWPEARVMLELKVGGCRLDVAFVEPKKLIGVEIKSERDTLERLDEQLRQFQREVPEMWVAAAPKWMSKLDDLPWNVGRLTLDGDRVTSEIPIREGLTRRHEAKADVMLTSPMLHLLWRAEAQALAAQHAIKLPSRMPLRTIVQVLARRLTGDEIVEGVCSALGRRRQGPWADAVACIRTPTAEELAWGKSVAERKGLFDAARARLTEQEGRS